MLFMYSQTLNKYLLNYIRALCRIRCWRPSNVPVDTVIKTVIRAKDEKEEMA